MMPQLCFGLHKLLPRKKNKEEAAAAVGECCAVGRNGRLPRHNNSIHCNGKLRNPTPTGFPLRSTRRDRIEEEFTGSTKMANKVTTISDIINRVASSCLTHRIPGGGALDDGDYDGELEDYLEDHERAGMKLGKGAKGEDGDQEEEEEEEEQDLRIWEEEEEEGRRRRRTSSGGGLDRGREMECFMHEVFDAVSAAKRAYVGLQAAHSPWDPDKIRVADAAVVAELRKLGRLRDRFRRGHSLSAASMTATASPPLRDVVAPYEAAIEDLKRELKAKEAEMDNLKEKLRNATALGGSGRRGRAHSSKRVGCISVLSAGAPGGSATPEMFETYMEEVKAATKSFTGHLLSLMRSARWDIAAAVRSIISGGGVGGGDGVVISDGLDPHHAKYALESYVNRKIFQGFENETFYIEGSLGSLLRPAEFRRDCFAQFRDMKGMDPAELLGVLPSCQFGQFAAKKYAAVVHQKMEESLFGSTEQRRQVMAGAHPRTGFYGEFLRVAKAVWLLHLLAFALDPPPCHFEASKGAEFHPDYMESVTRFGGGGGRVPAGSVVAFPVAPGFKLGDGSVIRARVYLLSGSRRL